MAYAQEQECELWIYKYAPADDQLFVKSADNYVFTGLWEEDNKDAFRLNGGAPFRFQYYALRNCPDLSQCAAFFWKSCFGKQANDQTVETSDASGGFANNNLFSAGTLVRSVYLQCGIVYPGQGE